MDKQKMRLPFAPHSPKQNRNSSTSTEVCFPPLQFQGLGGRILVILDCAVLAGLDWNAAWLHDVWFFVCCTLPTSQSSQNLTAAHLFSLPPPQRAPPPPPTVRMQPLNPSPDNGKSARWSLFPVSHPPHPSPRVLKGCRHPQTPSFK